MDLLDSYYRGRQINMLDQQNQERLAQTKLQTDRQAYNFDRQQQKDQYQDQKRDEMIQRVKNQYKIVSQQTIDKGITNALKGNYSDLKAILTNNTDSNPNLDIKKELEASIGGQIIDIKAPDPAMLSKEEQLHPDQVAVDIITPTGEKQTNYLSLGYLGAMVGTPNRVGGQHFTDLASGRYKNVSNAGKAILDSIGFDGSYKNLESNLALMATLHKDPKSKELLNTVREIASKDGEALLKELTAQYGRAETPADRAVIAEKIKDTYSMLSALQAKKPKEPKQLSQKDQLIQEYREATKSGDLGKASQIMDTYQKFFGKALTPDKKALEREHANQAYDKLNQEFTVDKAYDSNPTDPTKYKKLQDYLSTLKTDGQRNAVVRQLSNKLLAEDLRNKRELDLTSEKLRTGRLDKAGNNLLQHLKVLEQTDTSLPSNSRFKDSKKNLDSAIYTMKNANTIAEEYDLAKKRGLFSGVESSGVITTVRQNIAKWVGDLIGSDDDEKTKQAVSSKVNATIAKLDEYNELKSKSKLTKDEQSKLNSLAKDLQVDNTQKWKTETYIVLKKMLQSISGMGVTNQELESFKQAFSGDDQAMLNYMSNQLTYSAGAVMKVANTEYNNLTSIGANYTAIDSILRLRNAGEYIIQKHNLDVNANVDNKVAYKSDFEALHPEAFNKFTTSVASKLDMSPSMVHEVVNKVNDALQSGDSMASFLRRNPLLDKDKVLAVLKAYQTAYKAVSTSTQPTPTPTPTPTTTPQSEPLSDDYLKEQISKKESGGDYNAVSKKSSAYGKYQLIDSTRKRVAKELGLSESAIKTKEGQEKAMDYLLKEYKANLTAFKAPITEENIYTMHQLGAGRAKRYFKGTLTADDIRIMWQNLPERDRKVVDKRDREKVIELWNKQYRGGLNGYDTI